MTTVSGREELLAKCKSLRSRACRASFGGAEVKKEEEEEGR